MLASDFHCGQAILAIKYKNIANENVIRSVPEILSRRQNFITLVSASRLVLIITEEYSSFPTCSGNPILQDELEYAFLLCPPYLC